jgi:hypothetical protein
MFLLFLLIGAASLVSLAGGTLEPAGPLVLVVLTFAALGIFSRAARTDPEGPFLFQVLVFAWLAKLGSLAFKWYLLFNVYHGADTFEYHRGGEQIAALIASGGFPDLSSHVWGTEFISLFTGFLYLVTTPTLFGAWVAFAFLGSMGILLHYKAFVTALPGSNRRFFLLLVSLYPSILMWTNSLGKDALIAFFLGVAVYGAALIYRRGMGIGSLLWTLLGLGGVFMVRPHVAAIVAAALVAVVLIRPIRAGMLTPIVRIAGLAAFVVVAVLVVRTSASFVNLEDLSVEGVSAFLEEEQSSTETGSSAFEGGLPTTPQGFALGVITVLFRPFPWEAHNILAMISAVEGVALLAMMIWRRRSVWGAIRSIGRNGYLAFVTIYIALFVVFFSAISNFGILARQRVQLLPFLLVWLAYQGARGESGRRELAS